MVDKMVDTYNLLSSALTGVIVIVTALSIVGLSWWVVNGDQRWLSSIRERLLTRFPAVGDKWLSTMVAAWKDQHGTRVEWSKVDSGDGIYVVTRGTAIGKVLTCNICFGFWFAAVISIIGLVLTGSLMWCMLPFAVVALSSKG